jgi:hypothetical protein
MSSSDRFVASFYITQNNSILFFDIPYNIDIANSKFIVSGISGAMGADGSLINVAIPELAIPYIYNSVNGSHNIVATAVLGTVATKPTNRTLQTNVIGFPTPSGINNQSASLTIQLLDETGAPYADADIKYVNVELTFWDR